MPNIVKCGNPDCDYISTINDIDPETGKQKPCPRCGSYKRIIDMEEIKEGFIAHEYIGFEARKPLSRHKGNRADYESGKGVIKGGDGKLVFKKTVRDREHPESPGSYIEYVRNKDGKIIVNKSEKLSEHRQSQRRRSG